MTVLVVEKTITVTPTGPDLDLNARTAVPFVEIVLTGMATSGTTTVTVHRTVDGGITWEPIQDAVGKPAVGTILIRDFGAPLNVPVTYRARMSGATVGDVVETVTVPSSTAWIHDPLNPRTAVPVTTTRDSAATALAAEASATYEQVVDLATPAGGRRPVASIGVRQAASAVPLTIRTDPDRTTDLARLLATAGEVVLRGLPDWFPLPASATVAVGVVTPRVRFTQRGRVTYWPLTVTEVGPSSLRLAVPWLSWADFKALWPDGTTFADLKALRPGWRYLDWMRNPEG